jgi:hypothetical protein
MHQFSASYGAGLGVSRVWGSAKALVQVLIEEVANDADGLGHVLGALRARVVVGGTFDLVHVFAVMRYCPEEPSGMAWGASVVCGVAYHQDRHAYL